MRVHPEKARHGVGSNQYRSRGVSKRTDSAPTISGPGLLGQVELAGAGPAVSDRLRCGEVWATGCRTWVGAPSWRHGSHGVVGISKYGDPGEAKRQIKSVASALKAIEAVDSDFKNRVLLQTASMAKYNRMASTLLDWARFDRGVLEQVVKLEPSLALSLVGQAQCPPSILEEVWRRTGIGASSRLMTILHPMLDKGLLRPLVEDPQRDMAERIAVALRADTAPETRSEMLGQVYHPYVPDEYRSRAAETVLVVNRPAGYVSSDALEELYRRSTADTTKTGIVRQRACPPSVLHDVIGRCVADDPGIRDRSVFISALNHPRVDWDQSAPLLLTANTRLLKSALTARRLPPTVLESIYMDRSELRSSVAIHPQCPPHLLAMHKVSQIGNI